MMVSVMVPTKDRPEETLRFVHSLVAQSLLPHELIVIDAGGDSLLGDLLRQNFPEPRFKVMYAHTRRVGLTIQRNLGISLAYGDIVCFFDDDIILEKDCVKEMVRVFEEDKEDRIVAVTAQITNPWRVRAYERWVRRMFYLNGPGPGNFHPSGLSAGFIQSDQPREVESLYGGASAYRRWLFDEFKFDENLAG
jgi:glycosyltransferase involved in cell wall biosynthesis